MIMTPWTLTAILKIRLLSLHSIISAPEMSLFMKVAMPYLGWLSSANSFYQRSLSILLIMLLMIGYAFPGEVSNLLFHPTIGGTGNPTYSSTYTFYVEMTDTDC